MFGGSGKIGRGGGGASKRSIHAPPINRVSHPSMGGGPRGRGGAPSSAGSSPSASSMQVDESFSLVRENPLNFGMAVKLAPDLVEEIKRVEAQGVEARMKFDVNAKNPNENVIYVGDKIFRFTWSREPGDLCDIYEERRSGEDGNGLLVESGSTWRKLNVERELDESAQNHVKMRSEEAERKHKSRKAIVLDHQNLSMKSQVKAIAASESNPWKNFKNRKEPPFKRAKVEPPSGGPPNSALKSGFSTLTLSKGKIPSGSPLSFKQNQASPVGCANLAKGHPPDTTDVAPTQCMNNTASSGKEMHSRLPYNNIRDKKHHGNAEAKPADLKSMVISLLQQHQNSGMSLKALEKATGDLLKSARQLDPILKQVAIFKAPGRYFPKGVVEKENHNKPPSQNGSSPEISRHQSPSPRKFDHLLAQDPSFPMRTPVNGEEKQGDLSSTPLHTASFTEKIDILQNSPQQQLSDKKVSDNSEGLAGSSSDSESDSDSSDSDSDSGSHSRSPAGSSSDSESDASISSKQASDEDVDIMSDDDKEPQHKFLDSAAQWNKPDDEYVDIGTYEKQDDLHLTDIIEIEKDSPEDKRPGANYLFPNNEGKERIEDIGPSSPDHREPQERETSHRKAYNEPESLVNESFLKGKYKTHHDDRHSDEWNYNKEKFKSKNLSQPVSGTISSLFGDSPDHSSPDRPLQEPEKSPIDEVVDRANIDCNNDPDLQVAENQRSFQPRVLAELPSREKRPGKHDSSNRGAKYSGKNPQTNDDFRIHRGFNAEAHSEDGLFNERRPVKFPSEGVVDNKQTKMTEPHHTKPENTRNVSEAGPHLNSHADRLPVTNGRGNVLRREYSDLELGEFREPVQDITPLPKKHSERKIPFKQLENKLTDPECRNFDSSKGQPPSNNKITAHSGVKSSPRKVSGNHVDDLLKVNKVTETSCKSRFADAELAHARGSETFGDKSKRMPDNSTDQQHDNVPKKGSKKQKKPNVVGDSNGRQIDASLTNTNDGGQRKIYFSSDVNSLYDKYEKAEPELKSPIKDASQYKEYVKEYQEKYESYCSLNKILESYRDEFNKYGKDLENYNGRDMKRYHDTLKQMRSSYRQCVERHKRQKKIFLVLHEELKHLKQMIKDYAVSI